MAVTLAGKLKHAATIDTMDKVSRITRTAGHHAGIRIFKRLFSSMAGDIIRQACTVQRGTIRPARRQQAIPEDSDSSSPLETLRPPSVAVQSKNMPYMPKVHY